MYGVVVVVLLNLLPWQDLSFDITDFCQQLFKMLADVLAAEKRKSLSGSRPPSTSKLPPVVPEDAAIDTVEDSFDLPPVPRRTNKLGLRCNVCRMELDDDEKFCGECGAQVSAHLGHSYRPTSLIAQEPFSEGNPFRSPGPQESQPSTGNPFNSPAGQRSVTPTRSPHGVYIAGAGAGETATDDDEVRL